MGISINNRKKVGFGDGELLFSTTQMVGTGRKRKRKNQQNGRNE